MDATEAYIPNTSATKPSETTFFDFVDTPENNYNKSMKTLGVYVEQNNNENDMKADETKDCNLNNNLSFENSIFWNDKESIKLESGILDDINNWNDWGENKNIPEPNTDGAVYTLTVLNSSDNWYKVPDKSKKQENLDIDSFLSIIPETETSDSSNYYYSEYPQHNGFSESKDVPGPINPVVNNNDWKTANNNVNDSLLRNALQGKSFQRNNYAMCKKREENSQYTESSHLLLNAPYGIEENSTNNIDEILGLSTMDTFSDDYEKIKKIANEVADCAKFTMSDMPMCSNDMFILPGNNVDNLLIDNRVNNIQNNTITQGKCGVNKKYTKKSITTGSVSVKANNNGARKERSLHYCSICSKGFKDKYSVNVHVRTHTGEKPFTCNLCGKSFRQKAHLAKHYQTHLAQSQKHIGNGSTSGSNSNTSSNPSKSRSHKVLSPEQHR